MPGGPQQNTGGGTPGTPVPPAIPPGVIQIDSRMLQSLITQNETFVLQQRDLTSAMRKSMTPKFIPLEKYSCDSVETLSEYLTRFEKYCDGTYQDSGAGKGSFLKNYLTGEALMVYNSIITGTKDYNKIKTSLLEWYSGLEKQRKARYTTNFIQMTRLEGESITACSMRLLGLASLAFPGMTVKDLPIVREKLLSFLPASVKAIVMSMC